MSFMATKLVATAAKGFITPPPSPPPLFRCRGVVGGWVKGGSNNKPRKKNHKNMYHVNRATNRAVLLSWCGGWVVGRKTRHKKKCGVCHRATNHQSCALFFSIRPLPFFILARHPLLSWRMEHKALLAHACRVLFFLAKIALVKAVDAVTRYHKIPPPAMYREYHNILR